MKPHEVAIPPDTQDLMKVLLNGLHINPVAKVRAGVVLLGNIPIQKQYPLTIDLNRQSDMGDSWDTTLAVT